MINLIMESRAWGLRSIRLWKREWDKNRKAFEKLAVRWRWGGGEVEVEVVVDVRWRWGGGRGAWYSKRAVKHYIRFTILNSFDPKEKTSKKGNCFWLLEPLPGENLKAFIVLLVNFFLDCFKSSATWRHPHFRYVWNEPKDQQTERATNQLTDKATFWFRYRLATGWGIRI